MLAEKNVRTAGISRGLCVHLDCGVRKVTCALGKYRVEVRGESRLWAFSVNDGKLFSTKLLPASPFFEGLAVADGNIYLTTADKRILCFGTPAQSDSKLN